MFIHCNAYFVHKIFQIKYFTIVCVQGKGWWCNHKIPTKGLLERNAADRGASKDTSWFFDYMVNQNALRVCEA